MGRGDQRGMEQFRYIIINIVFTIFLIIGMIILTVHNRQVNGETNLHFLIIIAVIGLMLVFDTCEYFLGQLPKLNMLRYYTTAVCYTLRPVAITVLPGFCFGIGASARCCGCRRPCLRCLPLQTDTLIGCATLMTKTIGGPVRSDICPT